MDDLNFGEKEMPTKTSRKYKFWHLIVAFLLGAAIVVAAFLAPSYGGQGIILKRNLQPVAPVIEKRITPKINIMPQDINMNMKGVNIQGMDPGLVNIGTPPGN